MSEFTESTLLFRDIAEVDEFIMALLEAPKADNWHWPTYYLLYVEADRLEWDLADATGALDELSSIANERFAALKARQCAIVNRLSLLSRQIATATEVAHATRRLRAYLHPKSEWFQSFMDHYQAGEIAEDGRTLHRTVVPTGAALSRNSAAGQPDEHLFDLSSAKSRQMLAESAAQARKRHGQVCMAMMTFLLEHCTIHDLAHPTSM